MKVYIVGIGMGTAETLTYKAMEAIEKSDVLIGAERMLKPYKGKRLFVEYRASEIYKILESLDNNSIVSVLFSGDTGFYSGAGGILDIIGEKYSVEVITGISTLSYLCGKLKMNWQNMKITSLHGENCNIIQHIKRNRCVFALFGKGTDVNALCEKLCYYNMGDDIVLNIGTNLSYPDEKIISGTAKSIKNEVFDNLSAVIVENNSPINYTSIEDNDFNRIEKVPMTKFEVRCVSLAKLGLNEKSVVYDVGAGTGSVTVEMALKAVDGKVYAIEKNQNAISAIVENKRKFAADNIEIISGTALQVLDGLETPTHVFIGGTGNESIAEILDFIWIKNPKAVVVANAVTLETLCQLKAYIDKNKLKADIVQLSSSYGRELGNYHLMQANNPVYIIKMVK